MNTGRLPPYGRRLKNKMLTGWRPTNGIYVYCSWAMARTSPHAVCFPPGASPSDYDWTILAGQDITLINIEGNCDFNILKELAILIVQSGAARVGLVDVEQPLTWFILDTARAAA